MRILLPHQFKIIGAVIAPLGLATWLATQLLYLDIFLGPWPASLPIRRLVLVFGTFAFLFGMYFTAFSKEKLEDEMVQRTRLDSFMFAALLQIVVVICFFVLAVVFGEPPKSVMELFAMGLFLLFWLTYIVRFNYTLHFQYREWKTQ